MIRFPQRADNFIVQWLALALTLLTLGSLLAFSLYQEHDRIEKRERERLAAQAKVIDKNLVQQLAGIYRALDGLRNEYLLPNRIKSIELTNHRLMVMADAMPGINTFLVTDAEGIILASNRKEIIGRNFSHREYFQEPLRHLSPSTLYISPPFRTIFGNFVINISLSIPGETGKFAGVISASLNPEYFKVLLDSVLYAPDMWASLSHGDGKLFLLTPDRKGVAGLELANPGTLFTRHVAGGHPTSVLSGIALATGEKRLMAQYTIKPADLPMDKPLVVAVTRDMSAMFSDWRSDALEKTGLFSILVFATTFSLYFYQRRQKKFEAISAGYEAAHLVNAERLKLATEAADVGVWDYDLETGRLSWDEAMFMLYGQDPAAFSNTYDDWRKTVLPEDLPVTEALLQKSVKETVPFNTSFRVRRSDGEVRSIRAMGRVHANEGGNPVRLIGINEDITVRQQEKEALQKRERFLKNLTDIIPGMVGYWNSELICTFANNGYWTWFGKSPEEMIGIHVEDLLGEELFRKNEPFIRGALSGKVQRFERIMTKTDGVQGHTWAHYIPDIDGDQVRGFYVVITEVTELKQAQLQLEELNEVLKQRTEQSEQANQSKSRFLATVTHEFRTPLSLLASSTDILDRYGERLTEEQRAEQNGHIRSAVRQLSCLIDSVISFNSLDRQALSPVLLDIGKACRGIAKEVKKVWGETHDFTVNIGTGCGMAKLDEIHFRRVLENLLTNAFRYTPANGSVSLQVSREGDRLLMVITDTGIGIPEEDQGLIFDTYFRGRNVANRRGLGLGLSIVQESLLQMGGKISLTSKIGKGTTIQVEIPVLEESLS